MVADELTYYTGLSTERCNKLLELAEGLEICDICQDRGWVWMPVPGGFTEKMPCQRCKPSRKELDLVDSSR